MAAYFRKSLWKASKKLGETIELEDTIQEDDSDLICENSFDESSYGHVRDLMKDFDFAEEDVETSIYDTTMMEDTESGDEETVLEGEVEIIEKKEDTTQEEVKVSEVVAEVKEDNTLVVKVSENVADMETLPVEEVIKMDGEWEKEQVVIHDWVLPNFKANLVNYLDGEYKDGTEMCALRTVLLKNGGDIGFPSVHLGNLYLRECSDINQNVEETNRNLKMEKGEIATEKDLFVEIGMKCVEVKQTEHFLYTHFRAYIESPSIGTIMSMTTPVVHLGQGFIVSSSCKVRWSLLKSKLESEDPIHIKIHHVVGSPDKKPTEWGLNSKEEQILKAFMSMEKIGRNEEEKAILKEIVIKCQKLGFPAVAQCLKATEIIDKLDN